MAFRKRALEEVGGFDPQFRVAGDDVDLCWRLQEQGGTLGFSPAAMVWHHRRNSVRAYWSQQKGYGRAEALLERKWPGKYNSAGHLIWNGRIYGKGLVTALRQVRRIYHGTWGCAPFQRLYQTEPGAMLSAILMPEWYLIVFGLGLIALLERNRERLWIALPLFFIAQAAPIFLAWRSAAAALRAAGPRSAAERLRLQSVTAFLYILQPIARLYGRMQYGLSPCLVHATGFWTPRPRRYQIWSETWQAHSQWLEGIERVVRATGSTALRGGDFDHWDLEMRGGLLGSCRVRMAVEEHGTGRQLVRFRCWPCPARLGLALVAFLAGVMADAALSHAHAAFGFLATSAVFVSFHMVRQCGAAMATIGSAVRRIQAEQRYEVADPKVPAPIRPQVVQLQ
jgi:O-antigen biosynthesis protein